MPTPNKKFEKLKEELAIILAQEKFSQHARFKLVKSVTPLIDLYDRLRREVSTLKRSSEQHLEEIKELKT